MLLKLLTNCGPMYKIKCSGKKIGSYLSWSKSYCWNF